MLLQQRRNSNITQPAKGPEGDDGFDLCAFEGLLDGDGCVDVFRQPACLPAGLSVHDGEAKFAGITHPSGSSRTRTNARNEHAEQQELRKNKQNDDFSTLTFLLQYRETTDGTHECRSYMTCCRNVLSVATVTLAT